MSKFIYFPEDSRIKLTSRYTFDIFLPYHWRLPLGLLCSSLSHRTHAAVRFKTPCYKLGNSKVEREVLDNGQRWPPPPPPPHTHTHTRFETRIVGVCGDTQLVVGVFVPLIPFLRGLWMHKNAEWSYETVVTYGSKFASLIFFSLIL